MNADFLHDSQHRSLAGAFYPRGHVFAMLPDETLARQAAADLLDFGPQLASPTQIEDALSEHAADARDSAPSVGREDQFHVRFVKLARRGYWGLLFRTPGGGGEEALKARLRALGAAVAYDYGTLVIGEWLPPTPEAETLASAPV